MTSFDPKPEPPLPSIRQAVRAEVAARAGKGAFIYPIIGAICVRTSELWDRHRSAGLTFVALLIVVAAVRSFATFHVKGQSDDRAYRTLVIMVALQSFSWGSFVAALFLEYGLIAVTWLAAVASAGFAAGGTSSMGIDATMHRPFLIGMGTPILASAIALHDQIGITLAVVAILYCWFLLRDARQHAGAFEALLRAQHELRIARDQARAADRAKSAFLAMMSHEIRTPMHAVVGTASMLLETSLDDRQRRHAETIVRAGDTLVDLINDVLDLSRMDAQGTQLELADFELKPALLEVVQMFEPLARRAKLDFAHALADDTAIGVTGDRRRLQQILVNLIGNAIKFTERGGVEVQAHARGSPAGFEITLVVADTGIGIEPAQLERMFQPFEQADSGIARKYGGSGLGLAISKRLAEAMGGRIEVSSTRGEGTTFRVMVSLGRALLGQASIVAMPSSSPAAPPAGTRVLVVDDSALNRELAQEMLERLHCAVQCVGSGAEAIVACRAQSFDIVLMDCQMRDLDGYATTLQLRALDAAYAQVPIVAVTANALDDDRRRALEAGMNDLLAKPFGIRDLQHTLSRWVGAAVEALPANDPAGARSRDPSLYPQAIRHISAMLDGALDATKIDRVVEAFLQQWPQRMEALDKSLTERDSAALREIIHTLDGAVPYFGSDRLNAALRGLQQQARAGDMQRARAELEVLAVLVDELGASRDRHHVPQSA